MIGANVSLQRLPSFAAEIFILLRLVDLQLVRINLGSLEEEPEADMASDRLPAGRPK
jgi:hypothetical protein